VKQIDILIAHPQKHHVYHLAAGCQESGLNTRLLVPLYRKGLGACMAALPGGIGAKARGYYYDGLDEKLVFSPMNWQVRRMLTSAANLSDFQSRFDSYVAKLLTLRRLRPRVFVTMQDYMPEAVSAAKAAGAIIWSDQILNRSAEARARMEIQSATGPVEAQKPHSDACNDVVLSAADLVTVPSRYTADGLVGRTPETATIHYVPYGVDETLFSRKCSKQSDVVRVIARANDVRKGGHLLLPALARYGSRLLELTEGKCIQVVILGTIDDVVRKMLSTENLPTGLSVIPMTVPHIEVPGLLASADIFVMPSLSEGMSLISIEAMKMGLPIVITPFCGIDCFKHMEMGVEVTDTIKSLGEGLLAAFHHRFEWPAWGRSAKLAASNLGWNAYENKIANIARGLV